MEAVVGILAGSGKDRALVLRTADGYLAAVAGEPEPRRRSRRSDYRRTSTWLGRSSARLFTDFVSLGLAVDVG